MSLYRRSCASFCRSTNPYGDSVYCRLTSVPLLFQPTVKNEGSHYMEPGHWFISLYNDDGDPHEVSFVASVSEDMTTNCPNGCSGKGECLAGHCQCFAGFGGEDCSESELRPLLYLLKIRLIHNSGLLAESTWQRCITRTEI